MKPTVSIWASAVAGFGFPQTAPPGLARRRLTGLLDHSTTALAAISTFLLVALVAPSVASAAPSPVTVQVPGNPTVCPFKPAQACLENATRAYVLTDALGRVDGFSSWSGQSQCHAKGLTVWCSFRNDAETGSAVVRFRQAAGVWSGVLSVKRRVCLPAWPACRPIG